MTARPVEELRKFLRTKPKPCARDIYKKSVSLHQSSLSTGGRHLEEAVARVFDAHGVQYLPQACVNGDGDIIKARKGYHRHDFVIDGTIGDNIRDRIIVSCKVSLRERFLQDSKVPCKRLFLVTLDEKALQKADIIKKEHNIDLIIVGGPKGFNMSTCLKWIVETR